MIDLQNLTMDRLRDQSNCVLNCLQRHQYLSIKTLYTLTETHSPLRSFIVDTFIFKSDQWQPHEGENGGRVAMLKEQLKAGNEDFVLDCYETLVEAAARSKIRDLNRRAGCAYHTHEDGRKCK